ncbi:MAG: hypothetical protein NDI87_10430 [Rhodoferax sp.]|nr:hypothetical protein [Rhodoferax sp.]
MLGSASGVLLQQSSESLAGRVAQLELTPFQAREVFNEGVSASLKNWRYRYMLPKIKFDFVLVKHVMNDFIEISDSDSGISI